MAISSPARDNRSSSMAAHCLAAGMLFELSPPALPLLPPRTSHPTSCLEIVPRKQSTLENFHFQPFKHFFLLEAHTSAPVQTGVDVAVA